VIQALASYTVELFRICTKTSGKTGITSSQGVPLQRRIHNTVDNISGTRAGFEPAIPIRKVQELSRFELRGFEIMAITFIFTIYSCNYFVERRLLSLQRNSLRVRRLSYSRNSLPQWNSKVHIFFTKARL
jgi:hypothetical protein